MRSLPKYLSDLDPNLYLTDNYLVLDFETTNVSFGDADVEENSLLLSCWYYGKERKSIRGGTFTINNLLEDLDKADVLVAQNAKFELKWLKRAGFDVGSILIWDTMIAEYVHLGNTKKPLDLGTMAERYGYIGKDPFIDILMKRGVCPSRLPPSLLQDRCEYDIAVTEGIFLQQRKLLEKEGKLGVMYTRCILTPVLADIEGNGLQLHEEKVNAEYNRAIRKFNTLNTELELLAPGINFSSPKQLAVYLYEDLKFKELMTGYGKNKEPMKTASGNRCTGKEVIEQLVARTKEQKNFKVLYLERAQLNGELTKALTKFKHCVDAGKLLHARFNQTVTKTHRLSSSGVAPYNVQFQNLARQFKSLFTTRHRDKGWTTAEIDGAQLEFRVAAFLGQDQLAVSDIREGFDVHTYSAQIINDCLPEEVTKAQRQDAKADTFKPLFGGQTGSPAQVRYYEEFKRKYEGIAAAQADWKAQAMARDKVRTCTGLEFFYPNTKLLRSGYVTNSTNICNYPVQSLATADIIPIALTYLWHAMRDLESFIVNTVHDSAILELCPDEKDAVYELAVQAFTTDVYEFLFKVYGIKFNVPLGTGFTSGECWSEGEEITTQVEPPEFN